VIGITTFFICAGSTLGSAIAGWAAYRIFFFKVHYP